ncbi:hypothetical protein B0T14DRAFT_517688 [Immersiella caudata]|uniref:Uncharacterized protein n=1 Tax=Immersiella caudata TaxID=314043 RepID=A0AA39WZ64_9PEZI|nr:hypothetical protein B0T14DRAFT_517688 [Immersiella caudata]
MIELETPRSFNPPPSADSDKNGLETGTPFAQSLFAVNMIFNPPTPCTLPWLPSIAPFPSNFHHLPSGGASATLTNFTSPCKYELAPQSFMAPSCSNFHMHNNPTPPDHLCRCDKQSRSAATNRRVSKGSRYSRCPESAMRGRK